MMRDVGQETAAALAPHQRAAAAAAPASAVPDHPGVGLGVGEVLPQRPEVLLLRNRGMSVNSAARYAVYPHASTTSLEAHVPENYFFLLRVSTGASTGAWALVLSLYGRTQIVAES